MVQGVNAGVRSGTRVPDFFIVGHSKCGTTALYEMLRGHPQLHMPAKEPRYFALKETDLELGAAGAGSGSGAAPTGSGSGAAVAAAGAEGANGAQAARPRKLEAYLALFAGARADQLIGEATPSYLRSPVAAARIAAVNPDARIIALLREPTSFLRSYHLQSLRTYNETQRDFRKALELEPERRQGRSVPRSSQRPEDLLYSDHVRYTEQLRRYHERFGREQVLVLIYEDFRADNEGTLRAVQRFLGVDDGLPVRTVRTKPSREIQFAGLHQLVRMRRIAKRNSAGAAALSGAVAKLTPPALRGSLKGAWRRHGYGEPPAPDERYLLELRRRFKPEVVALSEYLGRDLVERWGYDRLA